MNTQQIEYFLAVASCLNFTEASRNLYVSQPSISRQIHLLEEEFSILLFQREKGRVFLTPEGKLLQEALLQCRGILDDCRKAMSAMDTKIPVFRLAFQQGTGSEPYIMDIINDIFEKSSNIIQPEIDTLSAKEIKEKLEADEIDLAIILEGEVMNNPSLEFTAFYQAPEAIIIGKSHHLAGKKNLKKREFRNSKFVVIKDGSSYYNQHVEHICRITGVNKEQIISTVDIESMILNIESGKYAAMVPIGSRILQNPSIEIAISDVGMIQIMGAWNKNNDNIIRDYIIDELEYRRSR